MNMNEQTMNVKFVMEVEKHPCLYNYELPQYSRKDIAEAAWNAVGKEMNLSGAACKEKWKNLRSVFVRHVKAAPGGPGSRKRKYYLMDVMHFILPFVKPSNASVSGSLSDDIITKEQELESESMDDFSCKEEKITAQQPTSETEPHEQSTSQSPQITRRKRKMQPMNEVDRCFVDFFKERQMARSDKDTRKMFLLSLQDEVNQMSEEQMRTFKRKVLTLIDDIMS